MAKTYVNVNGTQYPTDTHAQIATAEQALWEAGIEEAREHFSHNGERTGMMLFGRRQLAVQTQR